jgi:putative peptidoglycan lipid II flippase
VSGEGYMSVPGKFELTVRLARIMFGFLVLISTYAFFMSVLNSVKKFAVAAFAPCLFNLALISAAKVSSRFAASEEVLAWSVIVGGFVQMVVLVPAVMRAGLLPRPTFRLSAESLRVLKMLVPGILGMSVMHLSTLVSLHFASQLSQGTHSYIYFADRIFELPLSLFVVSVGSALLPTLASQWARGAREQMADTINHTMRLIVFVSLPAALGMFTLAQPICEVLFLGREFKYQDAVATAQVIQVYSFGLVLSAGVRILAQGFFAIGNTWFPAVAAGVALLSHVLFAWALTGAFGLVGLVASAVLSAAVNVTMLAAAYNSWVGSLELKRLFVSFLKFSVCGAAMVGSLMIYPTLKHAIRGGTAVNSFTLCLTISIGIFVYMLAAHVLRLPEYRETASAFAAKARAKLGRK